MMHVKRAGWCDLGNHPMAPGSELTLYRCPADYRIKCACPVCMELQNRKRAIHQNCGLQTDKQAAHKTVNIIGWLKATKKEDQNEKI